MSNQLDVSFDTPEPIDLYVENGRGRVDVTATDTTETTVRITGERAEEYDVRNLADGHGPRRIAIIAPSRSGGIFGKDPRAEIVVEVPVASGLAVKVGSSDVATHGRFADTHVDSGSGDVALDVVDGVVVRARIGLGGVAATPVRALTTEQALEGRPWTDETVAAAAEVMRGEGTPIDDMRASAAYRTAMLTTALPRLFAEVAS